MVLLEIKYFWTKPYLIPPLNGKIKLMGLLLDIVVLSVILIRNNLEIEFVRDAEEFKSVKLTSLQAGSPWNTLDRSWNIFHLP